MREILFRGKRFDDVWMEGGLFMHDPVRVCLSTEKKPAEPMIITDGFCDWGFEPPMLGAKVKPETVGQYTGLTDKNGKKIFEGDILRVCLDPEICVGKVIYDERIAAFEIIYANGLCNVFEDFFKARLKVGEKVWVEVIGNIHDNPELLEG